RFKKQTKSSYALRRADTGLREALMRTQAEKAERFRALHHRDHAFIIPNPWDVGTARLLETLGFEALATTSAGVAFSVGRPDGAVGRKQMLAHAAQIAKANPALVVASASNPNVSSNRAVPTSQGLG